MQPEKLKYCQKCLDLLTILPHTVCVRVCVRARPRTLETLLIFFFCTLTEIAVLYTAFNDISHYMINIHLCYYV